MGKSDIVVEKGARTTITNTKHVVDNFETVIFLVAFEIES